MNSCQLCNGTQLIEVLDLGRQPISHHYLATPQQAEELIPLALEQCSRCGLVQLRDIAPAAALLPLFSWVQYTEPEAHVPHLGEVLSTLPGITKQSVALGISDKDDSTINALRSHGISSAYRLDYDKEYGITDARARVETVQNRLTPAVAGAVTRARGLADIVVARHILEHAHSLRSFMESLCLLLKPDGYLVLELPDFQHSVRQLDYCSPWEEHATYLTPDTFRYCLELYGFSIVHYETFFYGVDNVLLAVGRRDPAAPKPFPGNVAAAIADNRRFRDSLGPRRAALRKFLEQRREAGPIAVFGAGHIACAFINFLKIQDLVDFIVDDHPNKCGMYLPGSHLPIVGSDELYSRSARLCLMTINEGAQAKVLVRHAAWTHQGGEFVPVFPKSKGPASLWTMFPLS